MAVNSLARFRQVAHRITGDRQQGRSYGVGTGKVPVAVDAATRLAYLEVLADEQKPSVTSFLCRAIAWFHGLGIECRWVVSDNGPAYVSKAFAKACRTLGLRLIRTRLDKPRADGKAERFIQTRCRESAYAMPFKTSQERNCWLPRYLTSCLGSGSTQRSAGAYLSSGWPSCSADEPGETQQLGGEVASWADGRS